MRVAYTATTTVGGGVVGVALAVRGAAVSVRVVCDGGAEVVVHHAHARAEQRRVRELTHRRGAMTAGATVPRRVSSRRRHLQQLVSGRRRDIDADRRRIIDAAGTDSDSTTAGAVCDTDDNAGSGADSD